MLLEENFLLIYFSTSIAIILLTAILVLVSAIRQQRNEYISLTIFSVLAVGYQTFSWHYPFIKNNY